MYFMKTKKTLVLNDEMLKKFPLKSGTNEFCKVTVIINHFYCFGISKRPKKSWFKYFENKKIFFFHI